MRLLKKLLKKWNLIYSATARIWVLGIKIGVTLRFLGARHIGTDDFENGLLKLNRGTSLGKKGEIICTPIDKMIYEHVIHHGEWESAESKFLSELLIKYENDIVKKNLIALVDIGANSGLVTRQILRLSKSKCSVILVEPIPNHIRAIQSNLKYFQKLNQIQIVEAALDQVSGKKNIRIQISNRGNSSFIPSVVPKFDSMDLLVDVLSVEEFYIRYLSGFEQFFIKSDTQGFDAKILSLLPGGIWGKCKGAIIEVWALPEVESEDIERLIDMWTHFSSYNWKYDGTAPTNLCDIRSFWLSKSGKSRNLYIK